MLLNSGDGSFQAKRDYPTGDGPDSVAIGDLNGDGKPDLATANASEQRLGAPQQTARAASSPSATTERARP